MSLSSAESQHKKNERSEEVSLKNLSFPAAEAEAIRIPVPVPAMESSNGLAVSPRSCSGRLSDCVSDGVRPRQ